MGKWSASSDTWGNPKVGAGDRAIVVDTGVEFKLVLWQSTMFGVKELRGSDLAWWSLYQENQAGVNLKASSA